LIDIAAYKCKFYGTIALLSSKVGLITTECDRLRCFAEYGIQFTGTFAHSNILSVIHLAAQLESVAL